ncbi:MAG: hypothetical protein IT365_28550 [Candidatus Hydrogenedentes bacterium]|nr:hypothetical protein [Candidatus Hydrogenedentota bacterium]
MKKRTAIAGLVLLGISLTVLVVSLHGPVCEAKRSCMILSTFADHIQRAEWAKAQAMLQTDPEWCRVEGGKLLYSNYDITGRMASAQPKFWKTLRYYLTDRSMGDKVIFQASSRADYAKLRDGKITFIKMP